MNVYSYVDDPSSEIAGKFLMRPETATTTAEWAIHSRWASTIFSTICRSQVWGGWGKYSTRGEGFRYEMHLECRCTGILLLGHMDGKRQLHPHPGYQLSTNSLSEDRDSAVWMSATAIANGHSRHRYHKYSQSTASGSETGCCRAYTQYSDYYLKSFANLVSIGVRYSLNFGKRLPQGQPLNLKLRHRFSQHNLLINLWPPTIYTVMDFQSIGRRFRRFSWMKTARLDAMRRGMPHHGMPPLRIGLYVVID